MSNTLAITRAAIETRVAAVRPLLGARPPVDLEVVIPALNEEDRLGPTLASTIRYLSTVPLRCAIVVVDNGSADRTSEIARSFDAVDIPVHIVGCATRGKGAAVRRGMLGSSATYIGYIDADQATPIATLDVVLPLLESGCSTVIGSRHLRGGAQAVGQGRSRRMGGWAFRLLTRRLLADLADTQCGFKFFRRAEIAPLLDTAHVNGFAFDVEVLARIVAAGHRIAEVPVEWVDAAGSSFSVLRHGWPTFHDVLKLRKEDADDLRRAS